MPSPSYVSDGGYNHGTGSFFPSRPGNLIAGMLECAILGSQQAGNVAQDTFTAPKGLIGGVPGGTWFQEFIYSAYDPTHNITGTFALLTRLAGPSEPGTYTFSCGSGASIDGEIRACAGTKTTPPFVGASSFSGDVNSTTVTVPALGETFTPGELYVGASINASNANPTSSTPALSHIYNNAGTFFGYYIGDIAPQTGAVSFGFAGAHDGSFGIGFSLLPANGVPYSLPLFPIITTVLVGTSSAQIVAPNPARKGLFLRNPSASGGPTISVAAKAQGAAVLNGAGTLTFAPMAGVQLHDLRMTDGLNAIASAPSAPFTIWEF